MCVCMHVYWYTYIYIYILYCIFFVGFCLNKYGISLWWANQMGTESANIGIQPTKKLDFNDVGVAINNCGFHTIQKRFNHDWRGWGA